MAGAKETAAFAESLRRLKERSGLSYGVLAKRLHMSTSTLHRYCNGDAVPVDYAPVERLARLCRATSSELVELHGQWVLATAVRVAARKAELSKPAPEAVPEPDSPDGAEFATGDGAEPHPARDADPAPPTAVSAARDAEAAEAAEAEAERGSARASRRGVLFAAAAVALVVIGGTVVTNIALGQKTDGGKKLSAGDRAPVSPEERVSASTAPSPSVSASRTHKPTPATSPSLTGGTGAAPSGGGASGDTGDATGALLAVNARANAWEGPCSQHYLVDKEPAQVPPPPPAQDATGWVGAMGAVASGAQLLALTVQGTAEDTVVLEALHVRVRSTGAPLLWNDYAMGVGCGGGVGTKSFGIDLDAGRPTADPKSGQRDFPYKVSETDPEVFYIKAVTSTQDVRWYLELDWSSGSRHGTVRVDDHGSPFRTSANMNRPAYDYPIGYDAWQVAATP
ncbi:helix-turn-helix transcriptional regulator [Streptomyces sp. AK02-01A]|uniref:helix-turn-helix domain-containing protein n=1 Tax=Streptomyces sp. AK02-01A TaxID=3028648 RepID=UPI0029B44E75|nr:helix-turn-helix transcriptional regulator [Streptomyces sp. AK02-01A]MDX3852148.1 helix-turn-helix transcriptional regulator [Streptomyces sp. AK02-01A]